MMQKEQVEHLKMVSLAIVGSGPAGLTAAIYGARGNVSTLVISGDDPGGQLMYTQSIENFPGIVTTGPGLIDSMRAQAEESGVSFLEDHVQNITYNGTSFELKCKQWTVHAKSVIIATGSNAKWLGLEGEEKFMGNGVSTCATCDGFAYKNKIVGVVGGGNTAVEDAIYLSQLCKKVILIHRRDKLRAEYILQERLFAMKDKVEFRWNSHVVKLLGENDFTGVILDTGEDLLLDGLFVAIGHVPNSSFLNGLLPLTEDGYIDTVGGQKDAIKSVATHIPGLFVAGDVMDPSDRQAVTAAGYGCMAARRAVHFLHMH